MLMQPTSLRQRTVFYLLLPTFVLLVSMSVISYVFVRNILLNQWGETAIAELQRTAHHIDMQLRTPKDLLLLLSGNETPFDRQLLDYILKRIEASEGVVSVVVDWNPVDDLPPSSVPAPGHHGMHGGNHISTPALLSVVLPNYALLEDGHTASLKAVLRNGDGAGIGTVTVVISFDQVIDQVVNAPWWQSNKAFLIDDSGNVLASTSLTQQKDSTPLGRFGETDPLEKSTREAMAATNFGTVFGSGSPPVEISGFYRLAEAPWTMVVMAPGERVLEPVLHFKSIYVAFFTIGSAFILMFILGTTAKITTTIRELSAAVEKLVAGSFGRELAVTSRDEIGELTRNFNKMTNYLRQRLQLKEAMDIAAEVQQNLLPRGGFAGDGLAAAGTCLYCDETGGDYFDIFPLDKSKSRVGVAVGDVVGHGIGAALLMTTVRALLRCRLSSGGNLGQMMADVNDLLCQDTERSGNFVTLFYLEAESTRGYIHWLRAGHDPAIVYYPKRQCFSELMGKGMALGVAEGTPYQASELQVDSEPLLILVGSDGAWEVENQAGEQFGKERLKSVLAEYSSLPPQEILDVLVDQINDFRGQATQQDDITLVILKLH